MSGASAVPRREKTAQVEAPASYLAIRREMQLTAIHCRETQRGGPASSGRFRHPPRLPYRAAGCCGDVSPSGLTRFWRGIDLFLSIAPGKQLAPLLR